MRLYVMATQGLLGLYGRYLVGDQQCVQLVLPSDNTMCFQMFNQLVKTLAFG